MSIVALQQLDLAVSAWIFHQIPTVAAPGHALATESGETSGLGTLVRIKHDSNTSTAQLTALDPDFAAVAADNIGHHRQTDSLSLY